MGFYRLFSEIVGSDNEESDVKSIDEQLKLVVDVEQRAGSIVEHYDLSDEDAHRIADILVSELTREEGYARSMIADRIGREVDVSETLARIIVDTEVASVRNLARVRKFTAQTDGEVTFRWIDSVGQDDSPVCADIRSTIDKRGPVTLSELKDIIHEAATNHEEGIPGRADELIPHQSCGHTVVCHMNE